MADGVVRGDRREDLLSAAARRFVADGIRATTMEDIARDAGAGKATLYRYFANKDAVIDALLERESERFARGIELAAAQVVAEVAGGVAVARLEAAFIAGVRFFVGHPLLVRDRDEEPAVLLPRITADGGPLVRRGLTLFAGLIADGIEAGELRRVDATAAAEVVIRLILSYFVFPPMHVRVEDPVEASTFAHALIAGGLRSRGT